MGTTTTVDAPVSVTSMTTWVVSFIAKPGQYRAGERRHLSPCSTYEAAVSLAKQYAAYRSTITESVVIARYVSTIVDEQPFDAEAHDESLLSW